MHFKFALISNFLLSIAVLASPYPGRNESQVLPGVEHTTYDNRRDVINRSGWAGVVLAKNEARALTYIRGTITVPHIWGPVDSAASAWVGIACTGNTIFRTGVSFAIEQSGPSYSAWYQWSPQGSLSGYPGIPVSPGDVIQVAVEVQNENPPYKGIAIIVNVTKNKASLQTLQLDNEVCGMDAEWILEKYSERTIHLPKFNTLTLMDTHTSGISGDYTAKSGSIVDMYSSAKHKTIVRTSVDGSTIVFKHE